MKRPIVPKTYGLRESESESFGYISYYIGEDENGKFVPLASYMALLKYTEELENKIKELDQFMKEAYPEVGF